MLGGKERGQLELFVSGSLRQLIPDDHLLARVAGVPIVFLVIRRTWQ
jgi:hypothetical protein